MLREVQLKIAARESELTPGFSVFRALPRREIRRVGGFVFLDHFDAENVRPDQFDVPPHPHIGLQTVTYLYDGSILHTDSLDYRQMIEPGAMNWMTSGSGITHAEQVLATLPRLRGLQLWVGLPHAHRKTAPAFDHFDAAEFAALDVGGAEVRVLAGTMGGTASPVRTFAPLTYLDFNAPAGAAGEIAVDAAHELAVYVAEGEIEIGGERIAKYDLAKLSEGDAFGFKATADARFALLGGEPLPDPTVVYWNFVADSLAEAQEAMRMWEDDGFPRVRLYEKIGDGR